MHAVSWCCYYFGCGLGAMCIHGIQVSTEVTRNWCQKLVKLFSMIFTRTSRVLIWRRHSANKLCVYVVWYSDLKYSWFECGQPDLRDQHVGAIHMLPGERELCHWPYSLLSCKAEKASAEYLKALPCKLSVLLAQCLVKAFFQHVAGLHFLLSDISLTKLLLSCLSNSQMFIAAQWAVWMWTARN